MKANDTLKSWTHFDTIMGGRARGMVGIDERYRSLNRNFRVCFRCKVKEMASDGRPMMILMSKGVSTNFVSKNRLFPSQRADKNTWGLVGGYALIFGL